MSRKRRQTRPQPARQYATPNPGPTAEAVAAELLKMIQAPRGATVTDLAPQAAHAALQGQRQSGGWGTGQATPLVPGGWGDPLVPFGPGMPIRPAAIDPLTDTGRPLPRRSEYPVSFNLPGGGDRVMPWTVLRQLADGVGIIRKCIEIRKGQITQLDWDFVASESAFEAAMMGAAGTAVEASRARAAMSGDRDAKGDQRAAMPASRAAWERSFRRDNAEQITGLKRWWAYPDRIQGWTMEDWLGAAMEEALVLDALSIYPRKTLGGDLHSLTLIDGSCYSDDTEVLTRRGWLKFADTTTDDEFATRNQKTHAFEWQQATYFHKARHDGPMYHFTSRALDLLVTPNHRMLVESLPRALGGHASRGRSEVIIPAEDLVRAGGDVPRIPVVASWDAPDLDEFVIPAAGKRSSDFRMSGDDFAAFMGMYLAEGHVDKRGSKGKYDSTVVISQESKSKGYREYKELLTRILGRPSAESGRGFLIYSRTLAEYVAQFGKSWEKSVPSEILDMSARQLEIFLHFYWLGDGWLGHRNPNARYITTTSPLIAGAIQEIAVKLGFSAGAHRRAGSLKRDRYDITLRRARSNKITTTATVPYTGDVYCVSVPNEVLYVRRNGKPSWCGNTIKPLLSHDGSTPMAPEPAFQQLLHGFPRGEFTASNNPDGEYTTDTLIYRPRNRRTFSPYGLGPVEQCIQDADLYMKRRLWMNSEYDDGVAPELLINVNANMTPDQLRAYETVFNDMLSGNIAERHRAKMLPAGFVPTLLPSLESRYRPDYDLFLIRMIGNHFDITAQELGFPPAGGLGGAGFDEGDEKRNDRRAVKPTARWMKSIINAISTGFLGMPDSLEFAFVGLDDDEDDEAAESERVKTGRKTINEGRDEAGLPRYDVPEADMPLVFVGNTVVPLAGLTDRANATVVAAAAMAAGPGPAPGADGKPADDNPADEDDTEGDDGKPAAKPTDDGKPGKVPAPRAASKAADPDGPGPAPVVAAGLAVQAASTGRVLMLQRALTDGDPAAGAWEFPGGCVDGVEHPEETARREWAEETGMHVPPGDVTGGWQAGGYVGVVLQVPDEDCIDLRGDKVTYNPDDPDGDITEALAWWAPADLPGNTALRAELAASLDVVLQALGADDTAKAAEANAFRTYLRRVRKGERPWRTFGFQAHPSHIAEAANALAAEGDYTVALACLDI